MGRQTASRGDAPGGRTLAPSLPPPLRALPQPITECVTRAGESRHAGLVHRGGAAPPAAPDRPRPGGDGLAATLAICGAAWLPLSTSARNTHKPRTSRRVSRIERGRSRLPSPYTHSRNWAPAGLVRVLSRITPRRRWRCGPRWAWRTGRRANTKHPCHPSPSSPGRSRSSVKLCFCSEAPLCGAPTARFGGGRAKSATICTPDTHSNGLPHPVQRDHPDSDTDSGGTESVSPGALAIGAVLPPLCPPGPGTGSAGAPRRHG